ncbi:hypothetical protein ACFS07_22350 [Undibacterium arcticum]
MASRYWMTRRRSTRPSVAIIKNCRVDILGIGTIVVTLQIRSSQDMTLLNGKVNRRLGCQFIDLPNSMLTVVQRYIMKLERERNSKATGLG